MEGKSVRQSVNRSANQLFCVSGLRGKLLYIHIDSSQNTLCPALAELGAAYGAYVLGTDYKVCLLYIHGTDVLPGLNVCPSHVLIIMTGWSNEIQDSCS